MTAAALPLKTQSAKATLGWSVFMLAMLCLYLIPEIIFNAKLVSIAGGRDSSSADLHSVELFGRAISGVGVTLLVADWLIRGRAGALRSGLALALVAVLVWPTVFFGQKWLIDTLLITPSTPEQRQQAVLSQLLRASLAARTVTIEGVPPPSNDSVSSASEMTFLTMFGALAYADPQLMETIEQQRGTIARQFVRSRAYDQFDQHYQDYQSLRDSVRDGYRDYIEANQRYESELATVDSRVARQWQQAEERVGEGWNSYRSSVAELDRESAALAEQIAPRLYQFFKRRNACRNETCLTRLDKRYRQDMSKTPIGYVEPIHWLIEEQVSTTRNLINTGVAALLSGGVTLAMQGLSKAAGGDGGWKDKEYSYTNDVSHYRDRIRPLMAPAFARKSGYPPSIGNLGEFRHHAATGQKVAAWARKQGLSLPAGWTMAEASVFRERAATHIRRQIRAGWDRKSGLGLEPGMSWDRYQRSAGVQRQLREAMGSYYVSNMRADWNNADFKRHVVDPVAERKARQLVAEVEAQTASFGDGQPNEDVARRALRATLVPPISMTLSLALVLVTLVKVPLKARKLWLDHYSKISPKNHSKRHTLALHGGLLIGVLALPVALGAIFVSNPYLEESSATRYFLDKVKTNSHPISSLALNWAIRAQPVLLPAGLGLDQCLSVFESFSIFEPRLDRWDNAIAAVGVRYREARMETTKQ